MKKLKRPRTLKDLQNDPRVSSAHSEAGGFDSERSWWVYLKPGWQAPGNPTSHTIHEETLKDVCDEVHYAQPYPDDPELKRSNPTNT